MAKENVLDGLVGLNLSDPKVEEKILAASRIKLTEPGTDCVHLFFGGDDAVLVERDETVASLKKKLDEMRAQGHPKIEQHGS